VFVKKVTFTSAVPIPDCEKERKKKEGRERGQRELVRPHCPDQKKPVITAGR